MTDQTKAVPTAKSEEVITSILKGAFSQLAEQLAKGIASTMDLPLVDESERAAIAQQTEQARQQLTNINQMISKREASIMEMSNAISGLVKPVTSDGTKPTVRAVIADMSSARKAEMILTSTHGSDVLNMQELVGNSLNRQPEIANALYLRLRREIVQGNLSRDVETLRNPTINSTQKAALVEEVNRLKEDLGTIDKEIDTQLKSLKNQY